MGGFLAAATRAPLMSILMLFEMTLDYGIVLPLMLVCVTASDLMRTDIHSVTPETRLREVLESFTAYNGERLPVVSDAHERVLVGSISKTDVLLTLAHGTNGRPH